MYATLLWTSLRFPKIDKPLVVYRFYCMALFHSQTRRHMISTIKQLRLTGQQLIMRNQANTEPFCVTFKFSNDKRHIINLSTYQHLAKLACASFMLGTCPILIFAYVVLRLRRKAKNRNQYNQAPHLTLDTTWESDKTQ